MAKHVTVSFTILEADVVLQALHSSDMHPANGGEDDYPEVIRPLERAESKLVRAVIAAKKGQSVK